MRLLFKIQVTEVVGHELLGSMQQMHGGLLGAGHSWISEEPILPATPQASNVCRLILLVPMYRSRWMAKTLTLHSCPDTLCAMGTQFQIPGRSGI